MRAISDELHDLVVTQAYLDRERSQSYGESEKSVGEDDGYGHAYGDHDGYDVYGDDDRSGGWGESGDGGDGVFKEGDKGGGDDGFNATNGRRLVFHYPLRPDAEDCSYYMKTGNCKFGFHCKFNHPRRKTQWPKDKGTLKEENQERAVQTECKFYLTSAGCKYGKSCKYNHSREKVPVSPIQEFNFLGLPMRPGEKECPYYMRTGSCKYGSNCRFHHPEPTLMAGDDSSSGYSKGRSMPVQGSSQSTVTSWSSSRPTNETTSYVPPMMYPPTQSIPSPTPEWNNYQAPVYQASEKSLPTPPAFAMSNSVTEKFNPRHSLPLLGEDYPERPGQPECSYFIKTGDCKYRSNCKFHHPKAQLTRTQTLLNDKGLPLRPDQAICSYYSRYGICKFGPNCKFDHPENYSHSPSSGWSEFDQPPFGNPDSTNAARVARKGSGSGSLVQQSV
nr:zinc finger CCCH domain-containing protein 67-like isoform X3 [Ipomoea batatas]